MRDTNNKQDTTKLFEEILAKLRQHKPTPVVIKKLEKSMTEEETRALIDKHIKDIEEGVAKYYK